MGARARRGRRAPPRPGCLRSRSSATDEWSVPLRELLAVITQEQPVMQHLRKPAAERVRDPPLNLLVRPVVGAADDVGDTELEIVGDGGRADTSRFHPGGQASSPPRRTEPSSSCTAPCSSARPIASAYRADRSLCRSGPSSHATPSQPRSSRIASSPPGTLRAGSVSSIRRTRTPPRASAKARLATALSALPRWSDPVGLGAKRTRTALTCRS